MDHHRQSSDDDEMPLIDRYVEHLRQCESSPRTVEDRRDILTRIDADLPHGLEEANADELAGWLYRDEWSLATKETYYAAIVGFFTRATDPADPWLSFDPSRLLPHRPRAPRGVPRPVTDEQLRRILTEAAQPYRLWSTIAAYEGLRCCEISLLDREHVTEATLFVVRGKGGKPRSHDTDPLVWAAIRDLPPGPVARMPDGQRASAQYISIRSAVYFRRNMNMPGVALHRLRHWLGVTVQREFKDIRVTQRMLGHESLQSTQIYTDASDAQQRAARSTLPHFDAG